MALFAMSSYGTMFIPCVLCSVIGCGDPAIRTGTTDDRSDDERIQGPWRVVSAERFKQEMPEPVGQTWTFRKGRVTFSKDDWSQAVTYSLQPNDSPKTIELGPTNSPRSQVGVYCIDDNKLTLCLARRDDLRPVDFTTAQRENRMIIELEREE
jgi:uncharacterized protein (TIGR03067 family)